MGSRNRFNGFRGVREPVEMVPKGAPANHTPLKRGVNESSLWRPEGPGKYPRQGQDWKIIARTLISHRCCMASPFRRRTENQRSHRREEAEFGWSRKSAPSGRLPPTVGNAAGFFRSHV